MYIQSFFVLIVFLPKMNARHMAVAGLSSPRQYMSTTCTLADFLLASLMNKNFVGEQIDGEWTMKPL